MASRYDEMMKTKPYLPLNMGGALTEAMIAKAEKELGETEDVKAKTIPELRQLVQAEPGLVCPTDDDYMLQFLRARKFDVQKAFLLLKNFYKVKKSNDDLFNSVDREALLRLISMKAGYDLPYRDEEGCAIVVIQCGKWYSHIAGADVAIKGLTLGALWAAREPATQVCGARVLFNAKNARFSDIMSFFPRHALLLAKAFTNCFPLRFKGLHVYNESPIVMYLFSFMKLFMNQKMKNRIYLHGCGHKHLHKFLPKAILPAEDFGGENPGDVAAWFNANLMEFVDTHASTIMSYGYRQ